MVTIRHHLHQNPELSFEEKNTAAFVADNLRKIGVDSLRTDIGGHGVIAEIRGETGGPTFALRADMDALPIHEANDLPYKSRVHGVMHACGHDGHTATLLGAAQVFAENRNKLRGTVRLIFQPAEEVAGGAVKMCKAGAMDGVTAIVALHGWPGMAIGQIGTRSGPMMASSDNFDISIRGKGAHAAMPHLSVDPILPAAQIVLALQTIASREMNPADPVVVTVGQIHAGTAYNIIPDEAVIRGTVRCLTNELRQTMAARIERIASGIAEAHRAEAVNLNYHYGTAVTYNEATHERARRRNRRESFGRIERPQPASPVYGRGRFRRVRRLRPRRHVPSRRRRKRHRPAHSNVQLCRRIYTSRHDNVHRNRVQLSE